MAHGQSVIIFLLIYYLNVKMATASISILFSAGNFIASSCKKYCDSITLINLSSKIDKLIDKDLYAALIFMKNAADCTSENEALRNVNEAYNLFVSASTMYSEPDTFSYITNGIEGFVRQGVNSLLGDNMISRSLTGVNKYKEKIDKVGQMVSKLQTAYLGLSLCSYLKQERIIAANYLDKYLFEDVIMFRCFGTLAMIPKIRDVVKMASHIIIPKTNLYSIKEINGFEWIKGYSLPNLTYVNTRIKELEIKL